MDFVALSFSFPRVRAEDAFDRADLGEVAERRRGRVRIDVIDLFRFATPHSPARARISAPALPRMAAADDCRRSSPRRRPPRHRSGAAAHRPSQAFQHQDAAAMGRHESFAPHVLGPARLLRLVVEALEGDRAHQTPWRAVRSGKNRDRAGDDSGFRVVVADSSTAQRKAVLPLAQAAPTVRSARACRAASETQPAWSVSSPEAQACHR